MPQHHGGIPAFVRLNVLERSFVSFYLATSLACRTIPGEKRTPFISMCKASVSSCHSNGFMSPGIAISLCMRCVKRMLRIAGGKKEAALENRLRKGCSCRHLYAVEHDIAVPSGCNSLGIADETYYVRKIRVRGLHYSMGKNIEIPW